MIRDPEEGRHFILANTGLMAPPHVPEVELYLADEAHELWLKTEEQLGEMGLQPPFWAFAWAGGQGLARFILDNPRIVSGKKVLDFATGSGLVAIAAKKSGASQVLANDIDPFCAAAVELNANQNKCEIDYSNNDLVGRSDINFDVILAGDIFYDRQMVQKVWPWLKHQSKRGTDVLIGDPGRSYLPHDELENVAQYQVPVTRALEDAEVKRASIWRIASAQA